MFAESPSCWLLALEFGGQSIKAARVRSSGDLVGPHTFALDQHNPLGRDEALESLRQTIARAKGGEPITAVGVGSPSPYDADSVTLHLAQKPAYVHLNGISLRKLIQSSAGCEQLVVANDAVVAAKGEIWQGGHIAAGGRYMMLTLGTGLGACYILDGEIVRGEDVGATASGELWDYPFEGRNLEESVGTTKAIVRDYLARGGSDSSIRAGNIEKLASLAREGNPLAASVFRHFGTMLARGLEAPVSRFRPRAIVLSGNLAHAFDLFQAEANRLASGNLFVKSQLIGRGGLLGAAYVALRQTFPS
jgi:glucokinase